MALLLGLATSLLVALLLFQQATVTHAAVIARVNKIRIGRTLGSSGTETWNVQSGYFEADGYKYFAEHFTLLNNYGDPCAPPAGTQDTTTSDGDQWGFYWCNFHYNEDVVPSSSNPSKFGTYFCIDDGEHNPANSVTSYKFVNFVVGPDGGGNSNPVWDFGPYSEENTYASNERYHTKGDDGQRRARIFMEYRVATVGSSCDDWLSTSLVFQSKWAAQLSKLAYGSSPSAIMSDTLADPFSWMAADEVESNQYIVAKKGGTCYVAFRGTDGNIFSLDFWTNLDQVGHKPVTANCDAVPGYHESYYEDAIYNAMSNDLAACITQCGGSGDECNLVFTGHSQGGAIAVIAGVDHFVDYPDNRVITFGAPRSIDDAGLGSGSDCNDDFDAKRHSRYVNLVYKQTYVTDHQHEYDKIPMLGSGAAHFGRLYILSSDLQTGKYDQAYIGLNDNGNRSPKRVDISHTMDNYRNNIESMASTYTMKWVGGFTTNTRCRKDDECNSGDCHYANDYCKP